MADKKFKALFISDLHLGTKGCKDKLLLKFLKTYDCDELYLVGDIIDAWRLQKKFRWPNGHNEILRIILKKSNKGVKVNYITGNHDEFLRKWVRWNLILGNISIINRYEYTSIKGERFLVVHGDMFDTLMKAKLKWIMHFGDFLYNFLIWFNMRLNSVRRLFGMKYWSLSKYLKHHTKQAVSYINGFEERLANYAKENDFDGIICGHIHNANMTEIDGIKYYNTGDWVESCTAIAETYDGEFILIDWDEHIDHN